MDEVIADDDACNSTGLVLGLGCTGETNTVSIFHHRRRRPDSSTKSEPSVLRPMLPELSLTLCLPDHTSYMQSPTAEAQLPVSFFNVKKEAETVSEETEKLSPRPSTDDEDEGFGGYRKKLRLTKDQSALLEESFTEHSTINQRKKLTLAKQLNLRPRQVEVWFQNRRARTKLKQTEADCEFLRRCYETLTNENLRLHRELQELKAIKLAATGMPLYMQLPAAATLTVCTSCERSIDGGGDGSKAAGYTAATETAAVVTKKTLFFNPFTHSAAC